MFECCWDLLWVFNIDLLSCCRTYLESQFVETGCTILLCLIFWLVFYSVLCLYQHLGYLIKLRSTRFYKHAVVYKWSFELLRSVGLMKETGLKWKPSWEIYKWVQQTQFAFGNAFLASKCVASCYTIKRVSRHLHFLSVVLYYRELFVQYRRRKVSPQL